MYNGKMVMFKWFLCPSFVIMYVSHVNSHPELYIVISIIYITQLLKVYAGHSLYVCVICVLVL